jgi:hypothetical protein
VDFVEIEEDALDNRAVVLVISVQYGVTEI